MEEKDKSLLLHWPQISFRWIPHSNGNHKSVKRKRKLYGGRLFEFLRFLKIFSVCVHTEFLLSCLEQRTHANREMVGVGGVIVVGWGRGGKRENGDRKKGKGESPPFYSL